MLCIEKTTLVPFRESELVLLLDTKGWRGVLPKSLSDQFLLQLADQLRNTLSGSEGNASTEGDSVALPIALLLLSKLGGADPEALMSDMTALQATLTVLSFVVEREIVNRLLQCKEGDQDSGLSGMFEELFGTSNTPPIQVAIPTKRLTRRSAKPNRPARSAKGSVLLRSHQ